MFLPPTLRRLTILVRLTQERFQRSLHVLGIGQKIQTLRDRLVVGDAGLPGQDAPDGLQQFLRTLVRHRHGGRKPRQVGRTPVAAFLKVLPQPVPHFLRCIVALSLDLLVKPYVDSQILQIPPQFFVQECFDACQVRVAVHLAAQPSTRQLDQPVHGDVPIRQLLLQIIRASKRSL
jgi:hypothetical protein